MPILPPKIKILSIIFALIHNYFSSHFTGGPTLLLKDFQVWSRTFSQKDNVSSGQNMTVFDN